MKLAARQPRVALIVPNTYTTTQEICHGILRFARQRANWVLHLQQGRSDETALTAREIADFDGVIISAHADRPDILDALKCTRVPTVGLDFAPDVAALVGSVDCNNDAIGRNAADWLVERGFRSFAFVGSAQRMPWSEERERAFRRRLRQIGFSCAVYDRKSEPLPDFLAALPPQSALLVANDFQVHEVLSACATARLSVPHDLAILSVDNYAILCECLDPPISSIKMTTEEAGFASAQLLDEQMSSRKTRRRPAKIFYTFSHVVERRSTARMRKSDPFVERALNFIRINHAHPVSLESLANALHLSKRVLLLKFKRSTDTTPHAELIRCRLEHAKSLLRSTREPMSIIAADSGFASASVMARCFSKVLGRSPKSFRK